MNPVVPPSTQVCDAPTVSVCINAAWLPFVCGALSQLAQPTTWLVSSKAELDDVLDRVADLISAIGTAMPCVSPPPVIAGIGTSQRACNIAGYLANALIKTSIQKAIDAINGNQTLLGYGVLIIGAIPGAGMVIAGIADALYGMYESISSGALGDYTDALADETLWSEITCAIFNATAADGQVTDTNFPNIQANVAAITYAHGDVMATIEAYLAALGATGLEQLQATGALAAYDCSACGTGVSTGPAGIPTRSQAGKQELTITAGTASVMAYVDFPFDFLAVPVVTISCEDPVLIASAGAATLSRFSATITAAVNVDVDVSATIDWFAILPGSGS